jgi:hypothetical protein
MAREKETQKNDRAFADECAQFLLDQIYQIDPSWKERDEACATEHGLSPAQRILKYVALVLDQGLHLNLLAGYDFIEPGALADPEHPLVVTMKGKCPECGAPFDRKWPGQICCSNECGAKHFPPVQYKTPAYDESFEKALEEQVSQQMTDVAGRPTPALPMPGSLR